MLLGTRKVNAFSSALINSSAVNQRLNVSPLTCGFSAAANFCQSSAHLLSILVNIVTQLPHGQLSRENGSQFGDAIPPRQASSLQPGFRKNCANHGNTRENADFRSENSVRLPRDRHVLSEGSSPRSRCYSFVGLKFSQKCSHVIHIQPVCSLPAGLRLETASKIDKKKSEFYFCHRSKKPLTEKTNLHSPKRRQNHLHVAELSPNTIPS